MDAPETWYLVLTGSTYKGQVYVDYRFHQMKPPPNRNDMMSGQFSERRSDFPRVVQHSILGNKWSVGGPLIDIEGRCIGMNIARANRAESFAIPSEELQEIANRMIAEEMSGGEPDADPDGAKASEE